MTINLGLEKTKKFRSKNRKQKISFSRVLQGLLLVLAISYFNYIPEKKTISNPNLKTGDISQEDVVVRRDITVEDREKTELTRKAALSAMIPIYTFSQEKTDGALARINEWFTFLKGIRQDYLFKKASLADVRAEIKRIFDLEVPESNLQLILENNLFQRIDPNQLSVKMKEWAEHGILMSKTDTPRTADNRISLRTPGSETLLTFVDGFYDEKEAEQKLAEWLSTQVRLREKEKEAVITLLVDFIPVSVMYSENLNNEQEKKTLTAVKPFYRQFKQGKVIARKGEEVTAEQVQLIAMILNADKIKENRISPFYLIFLIWITAYIFSGKYLVFSSGDLNRDRFPLVNFVTLLTAAIIYRIFIYLMPLVLPNVFPGLGYAPSWIFYSIPFAFGAIVIAFLFNLQSAFIFSVTNAIMSGIMCDWNIKIAIFVLISNMAVALAIDFYQRLKRSSTFKAGFIWLIPANAVMVFFLTITEGNFTWAQLAFHIALGIFAAVAAALFANFIIPLWEYIFKLVTDLKLVEITNLNLPVFREMLEKAPGTYHHSQMVASLAEAAAEDMSLSPLLLRAMALYHDMGKIENPNFFVENHSVYEDPHPRLSPQESAKAIIAHIDVGLELAEKLKLPPRIGSSITRHHGTKLVKYFYQKAVENSGDNPSDVNEDIFRYPGPKPQEIEDAIVMLADQVEAAAKSLSSPSDDEIKSVIEQIISSNIEENQFEDCQGLTFMALKAVAGSFFNKLASIYHQRVSYPGFQFTKNNHNDHHHKS